MEGERAVHTPDGVPSCNHPLAAPTGHASRMWPGSVAMVKKRNDEGGSVDHSLAGCRRCHLIDGVADAGLQRASTKSFRAATERALTGRKAMGRVLPAIRQSVDAYAPPMGRADDSAESWAKLAATAASNLTSSATLASSP